MEQFFKNKNLVLTVDALSRRYGKLPTEVLDCSLPDFSLNVAIMLASEKTLKETTVPEGMKKGQVEDLKGFSRQVIKIKKKNKDGSEETLTAESE
jgi:hypothetical protein